MSQRSELTIATALRAKPGHVITVTSLGSTGAVFSPKVFAELRAMLYSEYARLQYWFPRHGGFRVSVNSATLTVNVSYAGIA